MIPESSCSTSPSLIRRALDHDPEAWKRFAHLYTPLVYGWARRGGLHDADAADVVQEVFRAVFRHAAEFGRDNKQASFRGWLWSITRNRVRLFYRQRSTDFKASGGTDMDRRLNEYPNWIDNEQEPVTSGERHALLHRTLTAVRDDFDETTWRAFWRLTVEGHSTAEIAADLGISQGAVRQAKYRVLCRLREEMIG